MDGTVIKRPKNLEVRRPLPRQKKITLGEMRESDPRRLLVYCADYRYTYHVEIDADRWPDHVRLSELEPCQACGHRGADVRPLFEPAPAHQRIELRSCPFGAPLRV